MDAINSYIHQRAIFQCGIEGVQYASLLKRSYARNIDSTLFSLTYGRYIVDIALHHRNTGRKGRAHSLQ
jgi:hypothetical protein